MGKRELEGWKGQNKGVSDSLNFDQSLIQKAFLNSFCGERCVAG